MLGCVGVAGSEVVFEQQHVLLPWSPRILSPLLALCAQPLLCLALPPSTPLPPSLFSQQIKINGTKTSAAATLLLRGANDMHLDEMDRSLHDALCVVKRVLESGAVVPGEGGGGNAVLSLCCPDSPVGA